MNPVFCVLLFVVLISLLAQPPLAFANTTITNSDTTPGTILIESADDETSTEIDPDVIKGTGLCVGGAIIGSVVPILGTVIGCGVGAAYAWFTREPE